jgi:hypothetical protein
VWTVGDRRADREEEPAGGECAALLTILTGLKGCDCQGGQVGISPSLVDFRAA